MQHGIGFYEALEHCLQDKAWLAMIKSEGDFADVTEATSRFLRGPLWMGMVVTGPKRIDFEVNSHSLMSGPTIWGCVKNPSKMC